VDDFGDKSSQLDETKSDPNKPFITSCI